ncbi:hypothetical protein AN639_09740 [Candidatus Epulonipiscium fishelsonii]|uniref:Uncharacterized protein n=1 Tax=Candidatus Epulonipiscium fishelsonii TaxID=77094 RepID=A0ACC8XGM6_9FIRM|nr:hypothetical protein AN639_09740 [Epulopiscium sp. SCG-B05WGA-EpuloA1]ONI42554.1 hypothetical protein AN396_13905 [Epulopiscium sp. SCG-B11WGA-EpuloA1]ONI47178.1 hypothetical protein AN644_01285 [Epulopiscium sp. SCG-C06WGA-EpuloA1]
MINELLKPDYIIFNVEASTKGEAFRAISKIAFEKNITTNAQDFENGLWARENLDSTGFGHNLAIPHAKVNSVTSAALIIVKFTNDIEWESLDDEPVKMAFVIAVPENDTENHHISILSQIARRLMHDEFTEALLLAKTPQEVEALVKNN